MQKTAVLSQRDLYKRKVTITTKYTISTQELCFYASLPISFSSFFFFYFFFTKLGNIEIYSSK